MWPDWYNGLYLTKLIALLADYKFTEYIIQYFSYNLN